LTVYFHQFLHVIINYNYNLITGARSTSGEIRDVYTGFLGGRGPEGKRPLGRRRPRWKDNIKMDLQKVGRRGMDWIDLAKYRDRCWVP